MVVINQVLTEQQKAHLRNTIMLDKLSSGVFTLGVFFCGTLVTAFVPIAGVATAAVCAAIVARDRNAIKKNQEKLSGSQNFTLCQDKIHSDDKQTLNQNIKSIAKKIRNNKALLLVGVAVVGASIVAAGIIGPSLLAVAAASAGAYVAVNAQNKVRSSLDKKKNLENILSVSAGTSQKGQSPLKSRLHEIIAQTNQTKAAQNDKTSNEALPARTAATSNIEMNEAGIYTIDLTTSVTAPIIPQKRPKETTRTLPLKSITKSSRGS